MGRARLPFESPLVLAPIAGPGSPELTAAVANAGAFAFLACPYRSPEHIHADVARVRELTDRPFGINLFIESPLPPIDAAALVRANVVLDRYREELGIALPRTPARPPEHYAAQIDAMIAARPAVFSFTFGVPDAATLARIRDAGIFTMGTATTVEEAVALERAGIDAVCAQGAEAGGHRGTFLHDEPPLIGTLALVPQVVDAVNIPVVAAGGIGDGRAIAAVLALGADAAQAGTAFLLAREAATTPAYREALSTSPASATTITRAFSGRAARGIENRLTRELADPSARAPYPYQNALTRDVRNAAASAGRAEYLSLWAGQAFPLARNEPAADIVARLLRETRDALARASRISQ